MGASSRPLWTAGDSPSEAEEWFVDSLEQWRIHLGYEKIHLVAHSLSAFIATRYAEKYPDVSSYTRTLSQSLLTWFTCFDI